MAQLTSSELDIYGGDADRSQIAPIQEFNTDAAVMRAQQQARGQMMLAKQFPRNEDQAAASLIRACKRTSFADRAEYEYPRGKRKNEQGEWVDNFVNGPSAYLAREAMRVWGNMESGTEILRDTEDERHIRSQAWDMQTNARKFADVIFRKLIQRKGKGKDAKTEWVRPDERDLRELHNKHAAIAERNCILQLIPSDVIEDARKAARATLQQGAEQDPEGTRRTLINSFDTLNVSVTDVEAYLGHPVRQASPAELAGLRRVYSSIVDGQSSWSDHMAAKAEKAAADVVTAAQKVDIYNAYKAAGKTIKQVNEHLAAEYTIKSLDELPTASFAEMLDWAKQKSSAPVADAAKEEAATAKTATDAPATLSESDPEYKAIVQLFDILDTEPKLRASLIRDYAGRTGELRKALEAQLAEGN